MQEAFDEQERKFEKLCTFKPELDKKSQKMMDITRRVVTSSGMIHGNITNMNHEERIEFYQEKKAERLMKIKSDLNKEMIRNQMNPEINRKKKFVPLDHKYQSIQSKKRQELEVEEKRLKNNMDMIEMAQERMRLEEESEEERQRMLENTRTPDFAALQEIVWSEEDEGSGSEGKRASMFNISEFDGKHNESDRADERSYDTGQRKTLKKYSEKDRIRKIMEDNYYMTAYDRMLMGKDLKHKRVDHSGKAKAKQLDYGRVGTLKAR